MARLPSSDPLFIAENHSDNLPLDDLEIPAQMRARGLILENVDGTQPEGTDRPLRAARRPAHPLAGHQHDHDRRRAKPAGRPDRLGR